MQTVMVIGPPSLFRAGLISLLGAMGFDRTEEADDVAHLRRRVDGEPPPDLLLVSLPRSERNPVGVVEEIKALTPTARIVFLADQLNLDILSLCFAAGASGYLIDSISREALQESLRLVCTGEKVFPSELASLFPALTARFSNPEVATAELREFDLSGREIEILRCLAGGQSNKVIANTLSITEATVKVHVKHILRKAQVSNRTQAALWGVAKGVASAPPPRQLGTRHTDH